MILSHSGGAQVDLATRNQAVAGVARWFDFEHLKAEPRDTSRLFADLAVELLLHHGDSPDLTKTLDKLLAAKDAAVRCTLLEYGA